MTYAFGVIGQLCDSTKPIQKQTAARHERGSIDNNCAQSFVEQSFCRRLPKKLDVAPRQDGLASGSPRALALAWIPAASLIEAEKRRPGSSGVHWLRKCSPRVVFPLAGWPE